MAQFGVERLGQRETEMRRLRKGSHGKQEERELLRKRAGFPAGLLGVHIRVRRFLIDQGSVLTTDLSVSRKQ
jgi:hypothetical protein